MCVCVIEHMYSQTGMVHRGGTLKAEGEFEWPCAQCQSMLWDS